MPQQSYKNHVRFYPPHHFVFYPVLLILLSATIYMAATDEHLRSVWIVISLIIAIIGWLSFMLRQHYALTLQNRLVRLELRYRYFALTGKRLETLESKLTISQIFALRFAPDEELESLTNKAISNNMSADEIKKSIVNWLPDNMRV